MTGHERRTNRWKLLLLVGGGLLCHGARADEPGVAQLVPALEAPAVPQRVAALYQLGDLARHRLNFAERRNAAAQLGPRLAQLAVDPNPRIQQAALEAISRLNVEADVAAPAYEQALLALDAKARLQTAQALADQCRAGLAEVVRCDQPAERTALAARWLHDAARFAPLFGRMLADRDAKIRSLARASCDETWQQVAKLSWLGSSESRDARTAAAIQRELPQAAQGWTALAPRFGPMLQDGPLTDRLAAGQALESLARLLKCWEKQAPHWGLAVAQAKELRGANQSFAALAPSLLAVLPEAPQEVQLAVLGVIEAMETDADAARPQLLELCVSSKSAFVRWSCLRILTPAAAPSGEDWVRVSPLLQDEDGDVRTAALRLYVAWAGEPAVSEMAQAAYHSPHMHGTYDRRACVLGLAAVLDRGTPLEQQLALHVLGRLGEEAAPALPQLKVTLTKTKPEVRRLIPETLRHIGRPALPVLELCLADADEETRLAAARAMQRLGK